MKDPTAFRQRVAAYRLGKLPYLAGRPIDDEEYLDIMERVALENNAEWNRLRRQEGAPELSEDVEVMRILNDHSYDYRGFYNENPDSNNNASTHWPDKYKTYLHPTFSNQSIYSPNNPNYVGKTKFNPYEIEGGRWINNGTEFIPSKDMLYLKKRLLVPTYLDGKTPKTDAYDPYVLNKVFHNMNVPTGQCAEWANRVMDNLGYNTYGDAWLQHGNVLFNGYSNVEFPQEFDEKIYDQYSTQAADNLLKNFNSDALLDKAMHYIVNMYYPESPNKQMAAENGNGFYGTHTGVLFYDKDGKWKVAHNMGNGVSEKNKGAGKIWVEDFKQMLTKTSLHRPTAIITPNKHGSLSKARKAIRNIFGFADGKSPYDDDNMRITTLPEVEIVGKKPIRSVLNVESTNSFALPSLSDMIAPIPLLQYMLNFIRQYLHIPRLKAPYEFIEKLSIPKYDDGKEPGEEEYAIGTTMLPEVVIEPNMDLETNKTIESFFPEIFPEQNYDYSYYTRLLSRRKLNRFMEIYNEAGRPSIRSLSNYPHPDETKRYMSDGKTYRAYYRPDINTIYANNIYDVIAELAHPIQDKYGNNPDWKEYYKPKDSFGNWLRSVFGMDPKLFERTNYNADIDPRGGSRYQYPDRFEGETHHDFEPLLRSYLTDETIPNSINAGIGDYIYPQNGLYEVVDSAKSYNTQRLNLRKRYYVRPNQKGLSETY